MIFSHFYVLTYSILRFVWYSYIENHEDANELSEAEGDTKFEGRESRDHGRSSLPDYETKIILLYVNKYVWGDGPYQND